MPIQPMNFAGIEPRQHPFAAALQNAFNTYGQGVKARYLPLTTQAKALSQLTYSNLMGPQFIAKILGNPDLLANLSEEQKRNGLNNVYSAGTGLSNNNFGSLNSNISSILSEQKEIPSGVSSATPFTMANTKQLPIPKQRDMSELDAGPTDIPQNGTFAENTGKYKGVVAEAKELGKNRAKSISDLDDQYQQALQAEVPVNHLVELAQSDTFKNMRNKIPFYQDKQLKYLSKLGTPEEQKVIGDFITTSANAVANTVNSFKGRILEKEFTIANQMKISPDDTWNSMIGKLSSIKTFNEMTKQRSRIASKLIQEKHMNKGDALEKADKQIDGKSIRKSIDEKLNPKPTAEDIEYMVMKYKNKYGSENEARKEVMKKLKAKGLL